MAGGYYNSSQQDRYNQSTNDKTEYPNPMYIRRAYEPILLPYQGELLDTYIKRIQSIVEMYVDKSFYVHVIKGSHGKPFYSHTQSECPFCNLENLSNVLFDILTLVSTKTPDKLSFGLKNGLVPTLLPLKPKKQP